MTEQPSQPPARLRPPVDWRYRAIVTAALVVAVAVLVVGVRATKTGSDNPAVVNGRPDLIEHVFPPAGSQVLRQVEIGIDLAPGYEGRITVNGITIPDDELRLVPEQNQVYFVPGPDRVIEVLPPGETCVSAVAWESRRGRGAADATFRWCFDVT
ncbi:MAG TPA: hypothetical protein VK007_07995 [Acidimicrobiales bacterium]|nr:hypothetical protein [Acidimicrobiales bacterium]